MLNKEEVEKINELIDQGKSNYQINKETNYAINTVDKVRKRREKTGKKQTQGGDAHSDSSIDKLRGIKAELENHIRKRQLNDREREECGKLLGKLTEILRVEVDDRIEKERSDAVEKKYQEWNTFLEQSYIKKEVETNLKSTIQERDANIQNLREKIVKKDNELTRSMDWNQHMQKVIRNLKEENAEQKDYIENRLEKDVVRDQKQIEYAREALNAEKTRFTTGLETQLSNLETLFFENEEKRKANEMREKQLDESDEKIKKTGR